MVEIQFWDPAPRHKSTITKGLKYCFLKPVKKLPTHNILEDVPQCSPLEEEFKFSIVHDLELISGRIQSHFSTDQTVESFSFVLQSPMKKGEFSQLLKNVTLITNGVPYMLYCKFQTVQSLFGCYCTSSLWRMMRSYTTKECMSNNH